MNNIEFSQVYADLQKRAASFIEERVAGPSVDFDLGGNRVLLGGREYGMGFTAWHQAAKLAGLTPQTFDSLLTLAEGNGTAISQTFNKLFQQKCADRAFLCRLFTGGGEPELSGLLDERYAPIDHVTAIDSVLSVIHPEREAPFAGDTDVIYQAVPLPGGGMEMKVVVPFEERQSPVVGDVVRMGLFLTNNDLRETAPTVRLLTYTLSCTNGAIVGHPEDFGGDRLHRKVTAANRAETLATLTADCRRATNFFNKVVDRMLVAKATVIDKPKTVLAAVLEEFKVSDEDRAAIFGQFADLTGDETPIDQYDFVNRITRTAHVPRFESLGARVLALPLDRLLLNGSREARARQRFRVLQFAD